MSVVIDDFEVVANEEESNHATGASAGTDAASSPTVHDIQLVVERQCERYERVWAH